MQRVTRRDFVFQLMGAGSALALASCAPISTPSPTTAPSKPAAPAPAGAAAPVTQPAAATPSPAALQPKKGGRLTWGRPHDVLHFDSSQLSATQEPVQYQIFGTLTRLDDKVKPQPELAESWDLSSDYKKMQFKLRKGVTFHNGKELSADDVVATILRYQDQKTAANIRPQILRFKSPMAVDKYTVEISFDSPMATVFDALDLMFIWDKDNFEALKQKPNGTGPFKLAAWQPGDTVRLSRHDGYYRSGLPYLDEIMLKAYPDSEALLVALETGAVDMASPLRPRDQKRLEQRKEVQVIQGTQGVTVFDFIMNTTHPPFNDKRVRQAVSYAINRQRFVDTFLVGLSEAWSLPWPSYSPAFDATLNKHFTFNPDQAKKLLAEAGQSSGFEATMLTTRSRPGYAELAEQIQNDLAQVGIRSRIETLEEAAWRPKFLDGNFDTAPHTFSRNTRHPASMFEQAVVWRADKNSASYQNETYSRLVAEAGSTFDAARSKEIYGQLNRMILDECFTLCVAPETRLWGVRDFVKGLKSSFDDWSYMEAVWLAK